jgi:hypothetical protein
LLGLVGMNPMARPLTAPPYNPENPNRKTKRSKPWT